MLNYLVAFGAIAGLMVGWVVVQRITRGYAERHPETGPYREVGCAGGCGHCGQPCEQPAEAPVAPPRPL
jgi:hypothetical protein